MLLKNMKTGLIFKNPTKYFQGKINKNVKSIKSKDFVMQMVYIGTGDSNITSFLVFNK